MIQRFRFGLPLPTDSVVQEIPVSAGPVPFLTAEEDGWAYRMAPDASCTVWAKCPAASTSAAGTT